MGRQVYLGKNGQTFGPYTDAELTQLQTSGEIKGYAWIWDSENPGWKSLETLAPPPPPPGQAAAPTVAAPQIPQPHVPQIPQSTKTVTIPTQRGLRPAFFAEESPLEVTCSDRTDVITGQIFSISENGCFFIGKGVNVKRCFAEQEVIFMDLFDPKSKKGMKTQARLVSITQKDGRWAYQVQWNGCPEIIREI